MSVNASKCWYGCGFLDWCWECIQLHKSQDNLKFICSVIATDIISGYDTPSRLSTVAVGKMLPTEGATKGDPSAMRVYALSILSLIKFLLDFINLNEINAKEVVFADDFSVANSLNSIKDYWEKLTVIGLKYSYFSKPTKFYLIVKEKIDGSTKRICYTLLLRETLL